MAHQVSLFLLKWDVCFAFFQQMKIIIFPSNWKKKKSVSLSLVSLVFTVVKQWQVSHGNIKSIAIPNSKQLTELSSPPQKLETSILN